MRGPHPGLILQELRSLLSEMQSAAWRAPAETARQVGVAVPVTLGARVAGLVRCCTDGSWREQCMRCVGCVGMPSC